MALIKAAPSGASGLESTAAGAPAPAAHFAPIGTPVSQSLGRLIRFYSDTDFAHSTHIFWMSYTYIIRPNANASYYRKLWIWGNEKGGVSFRVTE